MKIVVTGNKIDVGESLRSHIEDSLASSVDKYFGDALEADVVLSRSGRMFRADISIHVGRGIFVRSHDSVDDPYAAFDVAAAHLAKRLRRYKRRLRNHHARASGPATQPAQQYVLSNEEADYDQAGEAAASGEDNPVIIAEAATAIEQLSVSEAVMRMDLADQPAFMFRNAKSGELNVIYRRPDGNIGWIDPQTDDRVESGTN
ncbi:MAG: ribosome-associated translation inhibitor RaiA [Alphaproteobacteria bacterium]|nr:ribosome-associated translation inhibitor RaiA [Alphaproteobacteria bacterium]